jgi:hypothetical protein
MKQPGTNAVRSEERTKIAASPMRVRSIAARAAGAAEDVASFDWGSHVNDYGMQ